MSNVIIGIIGVILFIGLAIAGATFIGPLITEGASQKNAAVVLNSLSQTAAATRIYKMRTGQYAPTALNAVDTLISNRILSSRPENPFIAANHPVILDSNGSMSGTPAYAVMWLGNSEQAMNACIEIELQSSRNDRLDPAVMSQPVVFLSRATPSSPGCHRNVGSFGGVGGTPNEYFAFFPI